MRPHYRPHWLLIEMGPVLLVYLFIFSFLPPSVFWSPDEGAKFIQLRAIRWSGGFHYQTPYLGQRLDPDYNFYPQSVLYPRPRPDGTFYANWPIWFPLLSLIPFYLFGPIGLYLIPLVSGLLVVALAGWLAYRLVPPIAPVVIIAVGLATPIFFYSFLFWEHTLAALMGLAALERLMRANRRRWPTLLAAGVLLVSAAALRFEMILYGLALALAWGAATLIHYRQQFAFKSKKGLFIVSLAGIIITFFCLLGLSQGLWLTPKEKVFVEYGLVLLKDPTGWLAFPTRLRQIWINTPFELGPELPGALTWLSLGGVMSCGLAAALRRPVRVWLLLIGGLLVGLSSAYLLFSPVRYRAIHSLFLPAPYLVLAALFWLYARQEKRFEVTVLALTTIFYLILGTIALINIFGGGLEWGLRYLLLFYALAGICAAIGIYHFYQTTPAGWPRRLCLGLAGLLLLVGIQYEVRGIAELQATKKDLTAYAHILEAIHQPVVTDLIWLPAALATRFSEQEIYTLAQREDLDQWLNSARGQVDSFLFVSFTPLEDGFIERAAYPLALEQEQVVSGMTFAQFRVLSPIPVP